MESVFVSVSQACELTGLGRGSVYGLINSGQLRSVTIGRRRLIARRSIEMLEDALCAVDCSEPVGE